MTDTSQSGPVTGMYELVGAGFFLQPTPAGAYYAVGNPELNAERYLLLNLMSSPASRRATTNDLVRWTGQQTDQEALAVVYRAQERGWLEGFRQPQGPPSCALEPISDRFLLNLSITGHGLLSDAQGFCIVCPVFVAESSAFLTPARLAVMSASLVAAGEVTDVDADVVGERGGMEVSTLTFLAGTTKVGTLMYRTPDGKVQEFLFSRR